MPTLIRGRAAGPFYALAFAALAVWCLWATRDHAVPIALGVLAWFLINAISDAIAATPWVGRHVPRLVARALAIGFLFGAIIFAGSIVAANVVQLSGAVDVENNTLLADARALITRLGLDGVLKREALLARFDVNQIVGPVLSMARSLLSDVSLVFLYALFLMVDERFYEAKLRALQPDPARRAELQRSLRAISRQTRLYLWLMTVISLGVALATWATCAAFGVAGAGFWGFLAFALNFIPTLGSIAAVLLPLAFVALTLGDPATLLAVAAILGTVQFLAGEVAVPRIMGSGLNLSSVVILLALIGWGAVWGPAGMFLAIPLTVILGMVLARFPATRPIAILLSKDGNASPLPRAAQPPQQQQGDARR
ncbi:MAG: putative PurR-regulated permease PerM [Paracoccaceae bacterium]|jgi:AI-2 transport protein TqsA